MDRLASHMNPSVLQTMMKANLRSLFIPVKSSSFIQPLDNLCFAKWKNAFRQILMRVDLMPTNNNRPKVLLEELVMSTEHHAFNKSTIIKSFKNTGLVPLSWTIIKKNAENAQNRKFSKENEKDVDVPFDRQT